jgi:hypothetical protein
VPSGVRVSIAGDSGIAKLVWKPLVVLVSEATVSEPTKVTMRTWKPAGAIGLVIVGDAVGEALGVDTEARRIRMLAVPVVICGLGEALGEADGVVLWFSTF